MKIPPFRLERFFAKYEFTTPHLLCSSDCESLTTGELLDLESGAVDEFRSVWLGYTESTGDPDLRREISTLYSTIAPEQVLVHSGAQEAIFSFFAGAVGRGDHMIVHYPCYQSLYEVAAASGCEITKWIVREEEGWALDLDFLRRSVKSNTKAIVVNSPHNPTGYHLSRKEFTQIVEVAAERNILLFFDEVFRLLEYSDDDRLPCACDVYENAISLGVMSKAFGLGGLRIGWLATKNRQVLDAVERVKDYTTICNSAPSQFLAKLALRQRDKLLTRNRAIAMENLDTLHTFFRKWTHVFRWIPPRAGPVAFPKILLPVSPEDFCADVASRCEVLLMPGSIFDPDSPHIRVGLTRRDLPVAISRLEGYLNSL